MKQPGELAVGTRLAGNASAPRAPRAGLAPSLERRRLRIYTLQMVLDVAIILGSFALSSLLYHGGLFAPSAMLPANLMLPIFLTVALHNRTYSISSLVHWATGARKVASALVIAAALLNFIAFFAKINAEFSRLMFLASMIASLIMMMSLRYCIGRWMKMLWGPSPINRLVIHAGGPDIRMPGSYHLDAGRVAISPDPNDPFSLDQLAMYLRNMDEVIVSCPENVRMEWSEILKGAGVHGEVVSSYSRDIGALGVVHHDEANVSTLLVSTGPLGVRDRAMKRLFDIAISALALVVLSPIFAAIAAAIWIEDRSPVLFRQRRMGKGNSLFTIYKFRTMRLELADSNGTRSASRDDNRITRVGRFLRRTSLDELPQLFNVLRGTMAIVGPRPHALGSHAGDKLFWQIDRNYWQRHTLRPGITGLAQVRGLRGATDTEADLSARLRADLEYLQGWTIWRDVAIVARTFFVLVHKKAF